MAGKFWIGGSGTWDNTNDANWSLSSGGPNNTTHPTSSDSVTLDGNSGAGAVITAAADVAALLLALGSTGGQFTGTLDFATNNNSPTFGNFAFSGTGTRTLNMGNGTWTIGGQNSTVWDFTTITGLTFNANASIINFTGNLTDNINLFLGTSLSYNTININTIGNGFAVSSTANTTTPTIATLNIAAGNYVAFNNTTYTITNAFNWNGASSSPILLVGSHNSGHTTIHIGTSGAISWAGLVLMKFNTQAVNATNSFDFGGNSMNGGAITPPSGGGSGAHVIGG